MSNQKLCKKCNESKPANRSHFGSTPSGGLRGTCRTCMNAKSKAYAKDNPQNVRDRANKRRSQTNCFKPSDELKISLFHDQDGVCALCCKPMDEKLILDSKCLQIDHLNPVCKGGTHDESNLVLTHRTCNQEKKQKTLLEYVNWRIKVGLPAIPYLLPKLISLLEVN